MAPRLLASCSNIQRFVGKMQVVRKTLQQIAEYLHADLIGDGAVVITGVKGIEEAGKEDLTFIANPKYRSKLETTRAAAVLVSPGIEQPGKNLLVVKDPYTAHARVLALLYPRRRPTPGTSPAAHVEPGAKIAASAVVFPNVYIGRGATISGGVILHPGVYIGEEAVVDEDSTLYPNVVVHEKCRIGKRVILHAGVIVGADGFGFADPGMGNLKVAQIGFVQIDDDVEIGANSTIDRGALDRTWIKKGVKIDNLVQIAHNVVIGENTMIAAQTGIAGSAKLGRGVLIGGQVGMVGHIEIGDGVMIGAKSGVGKNVASGRIISGSPSIPHMRWLRVQAIIPKLPEMKKLIDGLLKRIETMEKRINDMRKATGCDG
jgi:UDP-3-O-[3-hydroxymyristoyl] glucosamine N-acyltransferase